MIPLYGLVSPWVDYYRQLEALFGDDPDIMINYKEDDNIITLWVDGMEKADALAQLLPTEKTFGNVTIRIEVVPANTEPSKLELFRRAFEGNPAYSYALSIGGIASNDFNYLVFRNKVVQYPADNLNDINGNKSTLYENIARDVFDDPEGIMFCTDTEQNLGKPQQGGPIVQQLY